MKIGYCSDIHLEFGGRDFDLPEADVLLLVGDICVIEHLRIFDSREAKTSREFFKLVSEKYKDVIWIPGNHEFYGGFIDTCEILVHNFLEKLEITNIQFTMNKCIKIDDVMFLSATLWTDFNGGNANIMNRSQYSMNDYRKIMVTDDRLNSGMRYITPTDVLNIHNNHLNMFRNNVGHDKVVIISHHAPNVKSAGENKPSELDYAYCCTDVDDFILDNPQIKYWIHGHTHTRREYQIGDTTVVSNCRGYVGYENTKDFCVKLINV